MEKLASIVIDNHSTQYRNSCSGSTPLEIPAGTTHVELEVDYSSCYYSGDQPSYFLHCYKRKPE